MTFKRDMSERQACPRCDGTSYETTCMGGLDLDMNRCSCNCGWTGRGWEMCESQREEAARRGMITTDDAHRMALLMEVAEHAWNRAILVTRGLVVAEPDEIERIVSAALSAYARGELPRKDAP